MVEPATAPLMVEYSPPAHWQVLIVATVLLAGIVAEPKDVIFVQEPGGGGATQETVAVNPAAVIMPSDVNLIVRAPVNAVTVGNAGAPLVGPYNIVPPVPTPLKMVT